MTSSHRKRTGEEDEAEATAAARWRAALSHAKVQAMKARSAAQSEAAARADRLSKGLTAKPSPRERIKQQQTELNRAKIYAMNTVLARQADARWQELRREHGIRTPEPRLACTGLGRAQPVAMNSVCAATSTSTSTQRTEVQSSSPLAVEAIAGRCEAQSTPPLTPPSAPSLTCMAGELGSGKTWKFDASSAALLSSSPETQLPLKATTRRGSSGGCCAYVRRRSGTKVTQQARALREPG